MMTVDEAKRISAEDAFQHPWIQTKRAGLKEDAGTLDVLDNLKEFRVKYKHYF
jgi:hypothetical protein